MIVGRKEEIAELNKLYYSDRPDRQREKMRNQKNTSEGKKFAAESESPKSSCMLFDTAPTRSTKPIVKNVIITGMSVSLLWLELFIAYETFSY